MHINISAWGIKYIIYILLFIVSNSNVFLYMHLVFLLFCVAFHLYLCRSGAFQMRNKHHSQRVADVVVNTTVAVNNSQKKTSRKKWRKLFFLIKCLSDHVTNLNAMPRVCAQNNCEKNTKHQAKSKEVECEQNTRKAFDNHSKMHSNNGSELQFTATYAFGQTYRMLDVYQFPSNDWIYLWVAHSQNAPFQMKAIFVSAPF